MKVFLTGAGILVIIIAAVIFISPKISPKNMGTISLTSPAFEDNSPVPAKYTCDGEDVNPPLVISNIPEQVKSLALIVDDPDAIKPAGKIWDHWIVWNIPSNTTQINEGREPVGVHGTGTSGNSDYHGPCPPDGQHRYFFKLYALDSILDLPAGNSKAMLEKAMAGHILDSTELVGLYSRR